MLQLYKSRHFVLTEIRSTGKKQTNGILCFEGLPSVYGSQKEVTAIEDGVVLRSGINYDTRSREHRLGMVVTVSGKNGVTVTYGRLAHRFVNEGDFVHAGEVIGIEGNSGSGTRDFLTLEFRRNGRRVDGCEYLGLSPKSRVFTPPHDDPADTVCSVCGLSDKTRVFIDSSPEGPEVWKKILAKLENI